MTKQHQHAAASHTPNAAPAGQGAHAAHPQHATHPDHTVQHSRMRRTLHWLRKHRKAVIITAVAVIVLGLPLSWLFKPAQAQYVTAMAQKGDLQQTVEAVGTVTSERDLELKFPGAGIVESVQVKEGDRVTAGQVLAQLRAGSLGAAVAMQSANLQSAVADLRKMEEGTRPEDIAIAEAQVANKRAALQVAQSTLDSAKKSLTQAQDQLKTVQQEATTSLGGQVETARSALLSQLVAGETALAVVDDILGKTIVQDAIIKMRPGGDIDVRTARTNALAALLSVRQQANVIDYHDALKVLQSGQSAVSQAAQTVDLLFTLIGSLPETSYFTQALREQYRTSLSTQRGLVQSAVSAITTAYTGLQSAAAGFDTRISTAQSTITTSEGTMERAKADILTYQTAVQAQEADLALKRAGTRKADLDAARARVRQAQASLAQSQANYADTILRAPVDGTISHVNVKGGEATPVTGPAVTILGNSPFRVEMFVSEVDVPKLIQAQSGSIALDAFPDTEYKVHVSELDTAPTLVDGVSKYRVKLDFIYPHEEFKIGMTGDVTVVTGERKNIVYVPGRAVLEKEGKRVVRILQNGKNNGIREQEVTLGMEGQSGDVEVTKGLSGGETIVVLEK
ncbi:MAG: efflux RND transporter periplasmic adaptor subunit [Candidatus Peribacteraceae bacterium]|jgi:RND family efflux transporter MFP subunit